VSLLTSPHSTTLPGADLASIDAEIAGSFSTSIDLDAPPTTGSRIGPVDQASRLRSLIDPGARRSVAAPVEPIFAHTQAPTKGTSKPSRTASVITVASGKGGVGKTNVAVNLAIALASAGQRVTLLDADLGTANADVICGITAAARLDHVLGPGSLLVQDGGRRTIRDIAVNAPGGFKLVPGASGVSRLADLNITERRSLLSLIGELEADADVIIIDAAAGIGHTVTTLMQASDLGIVVTTPEPTALADAYALTKSLALAGNADERTTLLGTRRLGIVVNQAADALEGFTVHARFSKVCRRFLGSDVAMLGFIAQDVHVPKAVRAQVPLLVRSPQCTASHNMLEIAGSVVDCLGLITRPNANNGARRGFAAVVRRLLGV
jgi:flagellar biosynthesis protein FlhG